MHNVDKNFASEKDITKNVSVLLGLIGFFNSQVAGYDSRAILPYTQALIRFAAHIQQLDMESNGKRVRMDGSPCETSTGSLYFGEPGTNGQHSFFQLLHQGRAVPSEFIGFKVSQNPVTLVGESVSNHDELMSNFFAQPDALALGKTPQELAAEGVPEKMIPHKTFPGDRPSLSLLLPVCDARNIGLLLALYEHRTAVQGWVWGINSFDQWGVQLGKQLATGVGRYVQKAREGPANSSGFIAPTKNLLDRYLQPYDTLTVLTHHAQQMKSTHLRTLLEDSPCRPKIDQNKRLPSKLAVVIPRDMSPKATNIESDPAPAQPEPNYWTQLAD